MPEALDVETAINAEAVAALALGMRGACFTPDNAGYDDARIVWNGSIDRHPAIVARCNGVADVIDAVNFARANGVPVAVRGYGLPALPPKAAVTSDIVATLAASNAARAAAARSRAHRA